MADDIREIKDRLNIAEVVGDHVELRRRGQALWGCCPFHTEKTPSFTVSPERGTFHCFGCGKGGDIFTFVMEIEGVDFPEALRMLAERAGVALTGRRSAPKKATAGARGALEAAQQFFRAAIEGPAGSIGRAYLDRRQLGKPERERFGLGWSPAAWDELSRYLARSGITRDEMMEAGLVTEGDRGRYDRFRGRVMFPVFDESGRIVGFGGRALEGDVAKYINSPDGPLFNKSRLLYMLNEAKRAIRERKRAILTEGYIDVIRCHVNGFPETVASLGTSLTELQASLLKRFTDRCCIVYDGDPPGVHAAIRAMGILRAAGIDVRAALLPGGHDPDEILSSDGGAEKFEHALARALPPPMFHVAARSEALRSPDTRARTRDEILESLAEFTSLELVDYTPRISKALGIMQHELEGELAVRRRERDRRANRAVLTDEVGREAVSTESPRVSSKVLDVECMVVSLLWQDEASRAEYAADALLPFISDEAAASIAAALISGEDPDELEERWRDIGDVICPERVARGNALTAGQGIKADRLPEILRAARENTYRARYEELKPKILSETATAEEASEYIEIARRLKGPKDRI